MAELQYKVERLPEVWPGTPTPSHNRKRPPFKSTWSTTLRNLRREVAMLNGRDAVIALAVSDYELRNDGQLRANARPSSPAVILSFRNGKGERYEFPCDRFLYWQDNLDAIARAMEDLRRVDRYGVRAGHQYIGFKALPAKTEPTMTTDGAARMVAHLSGFTTEQIVESSDRAAAAIRVARSKTHPDAGGSTETFHAVAIAKRVLESHFGRSL